MAESSNNHIYEVPSYGGAPNIGDSIYIIVYFGLIATLYAKIAISRSISIRMPSDFFLIISHDRDRQIDTKHAGAKSQTYIQLVAFFSIIFAVRYFRCVRMRKKWESVVQSLPLDQLKRTT